MRARICQGHCGPNSKPLDRGLRITRRRRFADNRVWSDSTDPCSVFLNLARFQIEGGRGVRQPSVCGRTILAVRRVS